MNSFLVYFYHKINSNYTLFISLNLEFVEERNRKIYTYQTFESRNWFCDGGLGKSLVDIPHFDTPFTSRINVSRWVANGYRTNNFTMIQRTQLTSVTRNRRTEKRVWRERNRLKLPITSDVKRVGWFTTWNSEARKHTTCTFEHRLNVEI